MSVLKRYRKQHTQACREGQVKAETDAVTAGKPGATRSWKRQEKILTESPKGMWYYLGLGFLVSTTGKESISASSHQLVEICHGSLKKRCCLLMSLPTNDTYEPCSCVIVRDSPWPLLTARKRILICPKGEEEITAERRFVKWFTIA